MTSLRNVLAGIGLLCASSFSAQALPGPISIDSNSAPAVIPVAQGCGVGGWRGPYGGCRYGGARYAPRAYYRYGCPAGTWRGPNGYCRATPYRGYYRGYGPYRGYYRGYYGWR